MNMTEHLIFYFDINLMHQVKEAVYVVTQT